MRVAMKKHEKHEETGPTETTPLIECQQQLGELTDTLQRLQAEFENYKKRVEKENVQLIKNSNAKLIANMLPVLDSFELAIKNNNHHDHPEMDKFRKGLELIYAQLFSTLQSEGLQIIITENKKFDPYKHEVLMIKETDQENDLVLQEFQKGYMLNDYVLRHSKVMISKKKTDKNGTEQQ
jgi:molecular chaperone GrpE